MMMMMMMTIVQLLERSLARSLTLASCAVSFWYTGVYRNMPGTT